MRGTIFLNEDLRELSAGFQLLRKCLRIRRYVRRGRGELQMLVFGVINWEGKLPTDCTKTSRYVSARHRARIPSVKRQKYSFLRYPNRTALGAQNLQTIVEVFVDTLDQHRIVVGAGKNVAVNQEQIQCLPAYTKKFAVFVEDRCRTETVA